MLMAEKSAKEGKHEAMKKEGDLGQAKVLASFHHFMFAFLYWYSHGMLT